MTHLPNPTHKNAHSGEAIFWNYLEKVEPFLSDRTGIYSRQESKGFNEAALEPYLALLPQPLEA